MKTAYKWFDIFLNLLLISVVVTTVVIVILGWNNYGFPLSFLNSIRNIFEIILLISLVFGLLYVILGICLLLRNRKLKDKEKSSLEKSLVLKGIIRSIVTIIFFFIFILVQSFFGLSLESTHIPVVGDPNSPDTGFPIKYLKIINRKVDSDDPTECDITVLNTNPTLSAANVAISVDGEETIGSFGQDHIAPGKTDETSVDGGADTKNSCNAYIIFQDAGIVKSN